MQLPYSRTRALESQVDAFLDTVQRGILAMHEAMRCYLEQDQEEFERGLGQVRDHESQADELSRDIEMTLYTYSLLPESRGDVLQLLEMIDSLVDQSKDLLGRLHSELPNIPEEFRPGFLRLTEMSAQAADFAIKAARSYFRKPDNVAHDVNKVDFYESEADRVALKLKRAVFQTDLSLSEKLHLRYFVDSVESISDIAEDVGAVVNIATIKRSV